MENLGLNLIITKIGGIMILHPRPSPIAASMYQLRDVGADAIILHGPSGCSFRTARLLELDGVRVFTTGMDENDFIFGGSEKLDYTVKYVIDYLKRNNKKKKYIIGIVGTCPSMIIGEDLHLPCKKYSDDSVIIVPVEVHSGMGDNTIGAIKAMEACLRAGLIDEKEFERQKYILQKATEVERKRGMAKNKYLKPTNEDDLEKVIEVFKNLKKGVRVLCVLNAKKETGYLFAHPLIEINRYMERRGIEVINIANLDPNVGLKKIREDAKNILREYRKRKINIDYITGGLDEYPITGEKVVDIVKKVGGDLVVVSGVPHAVPIEEVSKGRITVGISDGPRLYYPIKEMYHYSIIELDAHAKVLGRRTLVKSRFGEVLRFISND